MKRPFWVLVHRCAGLAIATVLVVAGLTGSVIAFYHELDAWLNPAWHRTTTDGEPLSPPDLAARIERADPRIMMSWLPLSAEPGHTVNLFVAPRVDPISRKPFEPGYDELFADPVTGDILGKRQWGACCFEREHLVPFLYRLHFTLLLPGSWGMWLMGGIALIWAFDCFVGFYLTLPGRGGNNLSPVSGLVEEGEDAAEETCRRSWWRRWKPAWLIKTTAGPYRINFDLHRAGGLWFWGLLLILSVSGAYLNLHDELFKPAISLVSDLAPSPFDRPERPPEAPIAPAVPVAAILEKAAAEAAGRGWEQAQFGVFYVPLQGFYGVGFGEEHPAGLGSPWLYFDGSDGRSIGDHRPGEGTLGDLFMQIQFPLHSGQIAGLPGRIVVAVAGAATAMLSVTGVIIWLRKQQARRIARARAQTPIGIAPPPASRNPLPGNKKEPLAS